MPRRLTLFVATAVLAAAFLAAAPAVARSDTSELVPGRYIVVLNDSVVPQGAAEGHAARFGFEVGHVYEHALKGYSAEMPARAAALIGALPAVKWIEQDRILRAAAQTLPTGVDRVNADLSPTASIDGVDNRVNVDVAVIDTGVSNHVDLNVHQAGARNCSLFGLGSTSDGNGHGTHVAGTVGALDDDKGVVGVAPGARIWPVKVLNDLGFGFNSDIVCGIDYVASRANEIEVANMSLEGAGSDQGNCGNGRDAQHAAICRAVSAGVTFVVAAGNNSTNAANTVPAAYPEVITVSALADFDGRPGGNASPRCNDQDDTFAGFSNYGPAIDMIAPGVCILSTVPGNGYSGSYSGTSMAAPHVAGGAALYLARNPGASPQQVRNALLNAGSSDWDNRDDPDGIKEPLLDVTGF